MTRIAFLALVFAGLEIYLIRCVGEVVATIFFFIFVLILVFVAGITN